MSKKEGIKKFQTDVCEPIAPPVEEKICPTCIPNPDAIVPDWKLSNGEPFLNERDCEYQISVMINEEGDYYTSRDVGDAMRKDNIPLPMLLRSYVLPACRLLLRFYEKEESDDTVCAFPATARSFDPEFVAKGSGKKAVAAKDKVCMSIYSMMKDAKIPKDFLEKTIREIEIPIANSDNEFFKTQVIDTGMLYQYQLKAEQDPDSRPINPNGLEMYARVVDYDFGSGPAEPIKVLIGVPAHKFDEIPEAPEPETFDFDGKKEVILPGPRLKAMVKRLSHALKVYGKYQAYWWQTERATIYRQARKSDGTFVPAGTGESETAFKDKGNELKRDSSGDPDGDPSIFYIMEYQQPVFRFLTALDELLESNDARLTSFPNFLGDRVEEIKLVFEDDGEEEGTEDDQETKDIKAATKSLKDNPDVPEESTQATFEDDDKSGPLRIKGVWFKYNMCGWQKAKKGFNKFLEKDVVKDKTVVGYFSNLTDIDSDLMAKQTPGWLDFIVQYTYPPLQIKYETDSLETRDNPIACIIDNAGGPEALRDYIFNTVMSMGDAIAYQFSRNACRLITQERKRALGTLTPKEKKNEYRPTDYNFKDWTASMERRADAHIKKVYAQEEKMIKAKGKTLDRKDFETKAEFDAAIANNKREQAATKLRKSEALSHPYRTVAMDAALQQFPLDNTLLSLFVDEADLRAFGLGSLFSDPMGSLSGDKEESKFNLLKRKLDLCGITQLGLKAIQCLMGGVTADVAYGAILKAALRAMDNTNFEKFFIGLPYHKQLEIQEKVKKIVGELPPPWEWEPGEATIPKKHYDIVDSENKISSNSQKQIENDQVIKNINNVLLVEIEKTMRDFSTKIDNASDMDQKESFVKAYGKMDKQRTNLIKKRDKLHRQNEKLQKANDKSNSKIDKLTEYYGDLTEEDRQKMRVAVSEYKKSKKYDPEEKYKQGTLGKALGGVQKVLFDAYIDAILESVAVDQLLSMLDKFPGAKIIINAIAKLDCLAPPLIYPPIDSFLSTLTLDPCGPNRGKLRLPQMVLFGELGFLDLIKVLGQVFYKVLEAAILKVMVAVIVKILQILESALCKALEITGNLVANALRPGDQGGLMGAITDAFCGPDTEEDEEVVASNLLAALGVKPSDLAAASKDSLRDSHQELMRSMGAIASQNEFKELLTGIPSEHDQALLRRISTAIPLIHPEYAKVFSDPSKVSTIFAAAGNLLSPLQRQSIRDDLDNPEDDVPIDASICLTQDQLDQWNQDRISLFEDGGNGLTPEQAQEWVRKLNDRAQSDLIDAATIIANGIDGPMKDTVNRLTDITNTGDPDCALNNSAIQLSTDTTDQLSESAVEGMFKGLSIDFQKDLVGGGLFIRRKGVVDHILADSWGKPLRSHQFRARSTFIFPDWANDQTSFENKKEKLKEWLPDFLVDAYLGDEGKGYFPPTVGIHMQKQLLNNSMEYKPNYQYVPSVVYNSVKENFVGFVDMMFTATRPSTKKPCMKLEYRDTLGGSSDKFGYGFDLNYNSFVMLRPNVVSNSFQYDLEIIVNVSNASKEDEPEELKVNSEKISKFRRLHMTVTDSVDSDTQMLISEIKKFSKSENPKSGGLPKKTMYQGDLLHKYVSKIWSRFGYSPDKTIFGNTVYDYHAKNMYSNVKDSMMENDGDIPTAFKFGWTADSAITYKDLLYVNPEAKVDDDSTWFYDKDEEEAILGKSATENPRVTFLDPEVHGGWYNWPKVYVAPFRFDGMMSVIQLMVPEIDGCQPKRTDFLDSKDLKDRQAKTKKQVKPDKRLEFDEECVKKVPFDLVQTSDIHGSIDATVVATIRVYISEFILRAMPIFATLQINENNYDDGLAQMVVEEMSKGLQDEGRWYDWSYIKKYTYYLHFLEQAAQIVERRVKNGEIDSNPEIVDAFDTIRAAQKRYVSFNKDHFEKWKKSDIKFLDLGLNNFYSGEDPITKMPAGDFVNLYEYGQDPDPDDVFYQVKMGLLLGFYGPRAEQIRGTKKPFASEFRDFAYFNSNNINYELARRAAKIYTIYSVRDSCKTLLKYLVKEQLNFYSEKLAENMNPSPYITDLSRYYIGASRSIIASSLDCGISPVEKPIVGVLETTGEEIISYERSVGDCIGVSSDSRSHNSLSEVSLPSYVGQYGGFVIQKYVKIVDKPEAEAENVPDFIKNRPDNLRGIVSIDEFRKFVNEKMINNDNFNEEDYYLSDIFGDAELTENIAGQADGLVGSLGFKFGVRLCFVPPNSFKPPSPTARHKKIAQQEKAYYLPQAGTQGSSHIFPLASFEKDVFDEKIADVEWEDSNFGEDLRCYIDNLSVSPEFKMIFRNIFPLRRMSSIIGIYSYFGFLSAIGEDPSERHENSRKEEDIDNDDVWRDGLFEDTKHTCFRMFKGFYEADSWDFDWDWDFDFSFRLWFQDLFPTIFTNIDPSVRWWQRWRIQKTRPFDKDGEACKGIFGSVLTGG